MCEAWYCRWGNGNVTFDGVAIGNDDAVQFILLAKA